ncbi:MAG: FG-GAP-like repeat-containing protein [Pirellulaceae bacterium]
MFAWIGILVFQCGCGRKELTAPDNVAPSKDNSQAVSQVDGLAASQIEQSDSVDSRAASKHEPTDANESAMADLEAVGLLMESGEFEQAKHRVTQFLIKQPEHPQALFFLSQTQAATGDFADAIATLDLPAITQSDAALPALGQSAEWCLEIGRPLEAEDRYRKIVKVVPNADIAHRALSELMLKMGRPHAAVDSLRSLCLSGNIRQSELAALINVNESFANPAVGQYATARQDAIAGNYVEAIEQLRPIIKKPETPADVQAFYLRLLAESQQHDEFEQALHELGKPMTEQADYWGAIGAWSLANRDAEVAIAALLKAVTIDSTDSRSIQRLRQSLMLAGENDLAETWGKHFRRQFDLIKASNRIASLGERKAELGTVIQSYNDLAAQLMDVGRHIESVLWQSMAAANAGASKQDREKLREIFKAVANSGQGFPNENVLRQGIATDRFVFTESMAKSLAGSVSNTAFKGPSSQDKHWKWPSPMPSSFASVGGSMGLDHRYEVAAEPHEDGFAIYQTIGGGVAALDFDRDGRCDLYFAQGAADSPKFQSALGNQLFRHEADHLEDVSVDSSTNESAYSIGVTAGDWNQDGFDDLAVNQFGSVVMLTNNGDGTFRRQTLLNRSTEIAPSSVAMADTNNDGWVDLVSLSYADSPAVFEKPKRDKKGQVLASISPSKFAGAENQIFLGSSTGFQAASPLRGTTLALGTSLGVVVGTFGDSLTSTHGAESVRQGNQIFVGNDMQNNQMWSPSSRSSTQWQEMAMVRGCAFGNYGNPTAAMGIATADLDQDGFLDMHITNFQAEPVSLYMGDRTGFRDQSIRSELHRHSVNVLGFGCVAIDYDLNGLADLMVTNGHIDRTLQTVGSFGQPMQLFAQRQGVYELVEVTDESNYWDRPHIGRAMTKLDFNRDGREDVAITNMNEPSALLVNQTATDHHWLRLEFVGTKSPRYPVGTTIVIHADRDLYHWVVSGDGFLCRHEPATTVGLGTRSKPVSATVTWPNGSKQTFADLAVDQAWQLVEGNPKGFALR